MTREDEERAAEVECSTATAKAWEECNRGPDAPDRAEAWSRFVQLQMMAQRTLNDKFDEIAARYRAISMGSSALDEE